MPTFIDIGANLAHESFDDDRSDVITNARVVGVEQIVITGSCVDSNRKAQRLAAEHDYLHATAGVHPHHADDYDTLMHETIAEQMTAPGVIAAGECGLDYFRHLAGVEAQCHAFSRQLDLAEKTELPVFLHQRDAHDDFLKILRPRLPSLSRAVAHCFTAGQAELEAYLTLDLYIGITGWICDERRGTHLKSLVRDIPADRLLIETDAPYLVPRSLTPRPKTRRNEPRWLPEVARVIAEARGESLEQLAHQTSANARRFFALPEVANGVAHSSD